MRNVPSVTMKLGSPVLITSQPVDEVRRASATTSADAAWPARRSSRSWVASDDQDERRSCRSARRPTGRTRRRSSAARRDGHDAERRGRVEPVRDARGRPEDRRLARRRTRRPTIAPTSAPSSGRISSRRSGPTAASRSSAGVRSGRGRQPVTGCRAPASLATCVGVVLGRRSRGRCSTGWPPPTVLRLFLYR